nr:MAG TPA: hypothetical protein [Caudoviricetes sp.]
MRAQMRSHLSYSPQGLFLLGGERHWLYEEGNRNRRHLKCWKEIPAIGRSTKKNRCPRAGCPAVRNGWKTMPRRNGNGWGKSLLRWVC